MFYVRYIQFDILMIMLAERTQVPKAIKDQRREAKNDMNHVEILLFDDEGETETESESNVEEEEGDLLVSVFECFVLAKMMVPAIIDKIPKIIKYIKELLASLNIFLTTSSSNSRDVCLCQYHKSAV